MSSTAVDIASLKLDILCLQILDLSLWHKMPKEDSYRQFASIMQLPMKMFEKLAMGNRVKFSRYAEQYDLASELTVRLPKIVLVINGEWHLCKTVKKDVGQVLQKLAAGTVMSTGQCCLPDTEADSGSSQSKCVCDLIVWQKQRHRDHHGCLHP